MLEPENLAGVWQICDIRQLNPETGIWRVIPPSHYEGFAITLSAKWKTHLPLQGELYAIDFITDSYVVLHNPSNTVRIEMERVK